MIEMPDARGDGKKTIYPKMVYMGQNSTHQLALRMKKNYRIPLVVFISIFSLGFSSCLKEQAPPIAAEFSFELADGNQTSPVTIKLTNESFGADKYEWSFEGGEPSTSTSKNPENVTFVEAGEHIIRLKVSNMVEERIVEHTIRVDSAVNIAFDIEILVNDIAPADVKIINRTQGGSTYSWTFEGATIMHSDMRHPGTIHFNEGGEKAIKLITSNGSKSFEQVRRFTLREPMKADFDVVPLAKDKDWEAPVTVLVTNHSTNALSYMWKAEGGSIADNKSADQTSILFANPGSYIIELIANDGKRPVSVKKTVTIKQNSGILYHSDIKFGISQAKNSIGCFYSANLSQVLTSKEIDDNKLGSNLDIGFFGLSSTFDYCMFFSPSKSKEHAFGAIPNAPVTTVLNMPSLYNLNITSASFDGLKKSRDFDQFTMYEGKYTDFFKMGDDPHFVLFRTADGRRGIIRVKKWVRAGTESYILTDIKVEKRPEE